MLLHNSNYIDKKPLNQNTENFDKVSLQEIYSIKKRIDFYINHYKISTKNIDSLPIKSKLDVLLKLNYLLENELKNRCFI